MKKLCQKEKNWNLMWSYWLENKLWDPLEQLCTYENEMNIHGHYGFFELFETKKEREKCLNILYDSLPKIMASNLREAYEVYDKFIRSINKGKKYTSLEQEKIFLKYDDFYYNNEQIIYSNFMDHVIYIEKYIK